MINPKVRLITTQDGSSSLYLNSLGETYHSVKGALGESLHVYIQNGIASLTNTPVTLFEVGFGTGLNALLTRRYALEKNIPVSYHSLEPYPISEEIYKELGYPENEEEKKLFEEMHRIVSGSIQTDQNFSLYRYSMTLEDFSTELKFDIIYFDAFAPSRQPAIWAHKNLAKCYQILNTGGIMVTYCAQGQFKRDLKSLGFHLEVLPGALGKKEMVRARKL